MRGCGTEERIPLRSGKDFLFAHFLHVRQIQASPGSCSVAGVTWEDRQELEQFFLSSPFHHQKGLALPLATVLAWVWGSLGLRWSDTAQYTAACHRPLTGRACLSSHSARTQADCSKDRPAAWELCSTCLQMGRTGQRGWGLRSVCVSSSGCP